MVWLMGWRRPSRFRPRRQGDVDALGLQALVERGIVQRGAARLDGGRDRILDLVERAPTSRRSSGDERAQALHQRR